MTLGNVGPWLIVMGLVLLFFCIPPYYDPAFRLKWWLWKQHTQMGRKGSARPDRKRRQAPINWGREGKPRK